MPSPELEGGYAEARVHHAFRRRGGGVATRGARTKIQDGSNRCALHRNRGRGVVQEVNHLCIRLAEGEELQTNLLQARTGNFAKSWPPARQRPQITASAQTVRRKFPNQRNGVFRRRNRVFKPPKNRNHRRMRFSVPAPQTSTGFRLKLRLVSIDKAALIELIEEGAVKCPGTGYASTEVSGRSIHRTPIS